MTMAIYKYGKPVMVKNNPGSSYSAGDVVVIGNVPFVAHEDNPAWSGNALTPDAFAAGGGVYTIPADAAYAVGTAVFWDTVKQQVTTIYKSGVTYPFGHIVAGPIGNTNDGGPTGATSLADVYHEPVPGLVALMNASQPFANFRNILDGTDMTINPAQRGTSQAADIAATTTYGPDRFAFKGGASSAINWSINADTTVAGFSKSLKFQRKSANADTAAINLCQALESIDSIRMQGRTVTFSFWARSGANYSGGALTVQVESGTGTDQSAANLIGGTWSGQTHVVNTTQAITGTMTRYQFTGTVPAGCTQLGIIIQWTPVGTAGADDSVILNGFQLEDGQGASPYEHRDIEVELALCQRYFYQLNEPASGNIVAAGHVVSTNVELWSMGLPVTMRTAPTVTVTVGSFKSNSSTGGIVAATALAASGTHTTTQIGLTATGTGTAGQGATLQGGGGAGSIAVSADL